MKAFTNTISGLTSSNLGAPLGMLESKRRVGVTRLLVFTLSQGDVERYPSGNWTSLSKEGRVNANSFCELATKLGFAD